jgi:hypothetical protein
MAAHRRRKPISGEPTIRVGEMNYWKGEMKGVKKVKKVKK